MNELGTAFLTQNFLNTCHVPDLCRLQEPKIGKIKTFTFSSLLSLQMSFFSRMGQLWTSTIASVSHKENADIYKLNETELF